MISSQNVFFHDYRQNRRRSMNYVSFTRAKYNVLKSHVNGEIEFKCISYNYQL